MAVNTGKTKYVEVGRNQGLMVNEHITIGSHSYEKVEIFKYLVSLVTNLNSIREEIKCRLKAGNSCYYSVQTLLSSRLLSKNLKIKIHKTMLRRIFGLKRDAKWRTLHIQELHSLYRSPNIVWVTKSWK